MFWGLLQQGWLMPGLLLLELLLLPLCLLLAVHLLRQLLPEPCHFTLQKLNVLHCLQGLQPILLVPQQHIALNQAVIQSVSQAGTNSLMCRMAENSTSSTLLQLQLLLLLRKWTTSPSHQSMHTGCLHYNTARAVRKLVRCWMCAAVQPCCTR